MPAIETMGEKTWKREDDNFISDLELAEVLGIERTQVTQASKLAKLKLAKVKLKTSYVDPISGLEYKPGSYKIMRASALGKFGEGYRQLINGSSDHKVLQDMGTYNDVKIITPSGSIYFEPSYQPSLGGLFPHS